VQQIQHEQESGEQQAYVDEVRFNGESGLLAEIDHFHDHDYSAAKVDDYIESLPPHSVVKRIEILLRCPERNLLQLNNHNCNHSYQASSHQATHYKKGIISDANVLMSAFKLVALTQCVVEH
jgi:hypothetical protein